MNSLRHALAVYIIASLSAMAADDEAQTNAPLRLAVDLVDGSHIVGIPVLTAFPVQTAYAKMAIPVNQVISVTVADDHENAAFELANGDHLQGVLTLGPLKLATVFGKVSVDIPHVRSIRVYTGGEAPPTNGLALFLAGDGNMEDLSGQGRRGTVVGNGFSYTSERDGRSDASFCFNGGGAAVSIPDAPELRAGGAFTLAAWIKPRVHRPSQADTFEIIIQKWFTWGGGGEYMFSMLGDGRITLVVAQGVTPEESATIVSTSPAPVDQWTHVAGTFDRGETRLYMNGALNTGLVSKVVSRAYEPAYPNSDIKIGGPFNGRTGSPYSFDGAIAEVRVYNRALAGGEVRSLSNWRRPLGGRQ